MGQGFEYPGRVIEERMKPCRQRSLNGELLARAEIALA